ncbi:MAG: EamA family transporter, partial [Pseudomonadota bacterium]
MTPALRGHAAMLAFSALIAGSFALGSMAAPHIAPTALNATRFILAAVLLGSAAYIVIGIPRSAFQAPWRYLVLGGFMGFYFVM